MSDSENPEPEQREINVDLAPGPMSWRAKLIAAFSLLLFLVLVGSFIVNMALLVVKHSRTFDYWLCGLGVCGVLAFLVFGVMFQFFRQGVFTWMRLARQPALAIERGDPAAAERAYQPALGRARRFSPQDRRRGLMLFELAGYLVYQGRWQEARTLAEECVQILAQHQRKEPMYFIALRNFAVFLIDAKEYEAAQQVLEKAFDGLLNLKKPAVNAAVQVTHHPPDDYEYGLHGILVYLLIEAHELDEAKLRLQEVDRLFEHMQRPSQAAYHDAHRVLRALWHCAAGNFAEAEGLCQQTQDNPADPALVRARTQVDLARKEYAKAEQLLLRHFDLQRGKGTLHRPDLLPHRLNLAESLFGQAKHEDAFASFEKARSIVADFALPADTAWQKTLRTWLQRAKELGRTELAASLEAELQKIPANATQAITILEKLRIQAPAAG